MTPSQKTSTHSSVAASTVKILYPSTVFWFQISDHNEEQGERYAVVSVDTAVLDGFPNDNPNATPETGIRDPQQTIAITACKLIEN